MTDCAAIAALLLEGQNNTRIYSDPKPAGAGLIGAASWSRLSFLGECTAHALGQ